MRDLGRSPAAGGWRGPSSAALCLAALSCAYLYLTLFIPPFTPIWYMSDHHFNLMNAMQMRRGLVMYRDFFNFLPPGTELVYLAAFKLFGLRAWIPSLILFGEGLALSGLTFSIARAIVSEKKAALAALLFLTWGFRYDNGDYHWLSVLAAMGAMRLVVASCSMARLAAAAAFCGLASFFMPPRGVLEMLGLVAYVVWESRRGSLPAKEACRRLLGMTAVFLATLSLLTGYFAFEAGLRRFLFCTVAFVLRYYPRADPINTCSAYLADLLPVPPWSNLPYLAKSVFFYGLVPWVFPVFYFARRRARTAADGSGSSNGAVLTAMAGFSLCLSAAYAPRTDRLATVSAPAIILLVWLAENARGGGRVLRTGLWIMAGAFLFAMPLRRQTQWRAFLNTRVGQVAFLQPDDYERNRRVLEETRDGETFFYASFPECYYLANLRNPTEVSFLVPTDYVRPDQVRHVIDALEKEKVRLIAWNDMQPAAGDGEARRADHLGPLRDYLRGHYSPTLGLPLAEQLLTRVR